VCVCVCVCVCMYIYSICIYIYIYMPVLRLFLGSHGTLVAVSAPLMMPLRDSDIPMNVPFTFCINNHFIYMPKVIKDPVVWNWNFGLDIFIRKDPDFPGVFFSQLSFPLQHNTSLHQST
jgi:hypothetical protein